MLPNRQTKQYEVTCPNPDGECTDVVSANCVALDKTSLPTIGAETGDDLTYILRKIDELLAKVTSRGEMAAYVSNVGEGAEVWAGASEDLVSQLRTLKGDGSVNIVEGGDELLFRINRNWLGNFVSEKVAAESNKEAEIAKVNNRLDSVASAVGGIGFDADNVGSELTTLIEKNTELEAKLKEMDALLVNYGRVISRQGKQITALEGLKLASDTSLIKLVDSYGKIKGKVDISDIIAKY